MFIGDFPRIKDSVYIDDGYSGTNFERPDFKRMINAIEDGLIKTVIVKDMSRFGREYLQVGMYTEVFFPSKGVRLIAINDGVDTSKGDNDFTPFRNIINEWYAKDTSRKIRVVINARGKGGKSITTLPPLGYVFDENDTDKWIIDSRAAKIIRKIFKDFAKGKTISNICRSLNDGNVLSPTAYKQKYVFKVRKNDLPDQESKWVPSSVLGILDNPVYIGKIVNFKTYSTSFKNKKRLVNPVENRLIFDNHHEPIIDIELWETVQQLRQGRRKSCKRHAKPRYLTVLPSVPTAAHE